MVNKNMLHLGKERSAIRELFEQGKLLKEKYGSDSVFDFSIGNPSVPCPKIVNDTLISMLNNANLLDNSDHSDKFSAKIDLKYGQLNSSMLHGYSSAQGDKDVRIAISNYLNKKYNTNTSPDLIYMSSGSAAGLSITLKAISDGLGKSEVLVFAPFFPEYSVFVNNANSKLVTVNPNFENFYPDLKDFENKINKNTSAVIINSPNNPTGVLYKKEIIESICKILNDKQKEYNHPIYLISDEPYRELIYIDYEYPFITNYYDNSIVTYSFSKSMSLAGERIGYILVNPKCESANDVYAAICGAGRSLGFVCATTIFQYLIPYILNSTSDLNVYKNNAKMFYDSLSSIGYEVLKPDGAFYLFVKALEDDDKSFSKKALKYNLLIVPSESFGIKGYVRIAYCVKEKQITDSIPMFKKLYEEY